MTGDGEERHEQRRSGTCWQPRDGARRRLALQPTEPGHTPTADHGRDVQPLERLRQAHRGIRSRYGFGRAGGEVHLRRGRYITGIRFYKGAGNTGTHVGHLWTSTGTLLARATFTNETASGWQQVNFANPVAISANTTYVASYFAPAGHYAGDNGYFSSGYSSGPLDVPANGGVYVYGSQGGFPSQTWKASNYWVDVAFSSDTNTTPPPASPPADVASPCVASPDRRSPRHR